MPDKIKDVKTHPDLPVCCGRHQAECTGCIWRPHGTGEQPAAPECAEVGGHDKEADVYTIASGFEAIHKMRWVWKGSSR